ncbi:helix-turn-helix domain-containing protein [Pannus brasiliensis CCIBt3594]|uniref:Helix-turn-helix domain-containing protein n=1 Tax=Pannus brasiliensis CCIBt3594 TaxID=1427578 RepID=A0AAW9QTD4_9CHRO
MKSIPLVRVNTFTPFLAFLERLGSPIERWLEEVKISPFALEDPESLIPRHLGFQFLQKAARAEGIENLGLLVGRETSIATLGNFGRLVHGSLTLYDALTTIQTLMPVTNSGEIYRLANGGGIEGRTLDRARFSMYYTGDDLRCPHAEQFVLMQMLSLVNSAVGKEWRPSAIYLQTRQPKTVLDSDSFGGIPIQDGVGFTAIAFPRSLLSLQRRTALDSRAPNNPDIWKDLHASAPPQDLLGSLERAIVPLLRGGYPDIHLAAEIAGMSVRTLQRRLETEGLTYSRLVERARLRQAIRWLQDPSLQCLDISIELGYSAPPHFTRAFKRWTGLSPAEFRRYGAEKPDFFANFAEPTVSGNRGGSD